MMERPEHRIFNIIKLPMAIAVVMVHAGLFVQDYPSAQLWLYPVTGMLFWVSVPAFFFSSGFLFFRDATFSMSIYKDKLRNRLKSLIVPYFLWNLLAIILYASIQQIPFLAPYCTGMRRLSDYNVQTFLLEFWDRGDGFFSNGTPVLLPFWYMRNLILLALASPLIYFCAKRIPIPVLPILFGWWANSSGMAYLQYSLFFFTLGAAFAIHRLKFLHYGWLIVSATIILGVLDILLHYGQSFWWLYAHRCFILMGVFCALFFADILYKRYPCKRYGETCSVFVYASHFPLTIALCKVAGKYVDFSSACSVYLAYSAISVSVIVVCVVMYFVIEKLFPKVNTILLGAR